MMLTCSICGKKLKVKCGDHPEPFVAYDPMVGIEAYGPYSVNKQILHEFMYEGFKVLHLLFETGNEHLVMLPKEDGTLHSMCEEEFKELEEAREEYDKFCEKCCLDLDCETASIGGSELCPGCDCETILEDFCEDEFDEDEWVYEDDYEDWEEEYE